MVRIRFVVCNFFLLAFTPHARCYSPLEFVDLFWGLSILLDREFRSRFAHYRLFPAGSGIVVGHIIFLYITVSFCNMPSVSYKLYLVHFDVLCIDYVLFIVWRIAGFLWYFLCYRFGWTHILSRRCRTVPKRLVWKNRRTYKPIVHDDYDYDDEDDYDDPWHEPRVTKVVEDECYSHNDDADGDGDGDDEGDDATVYIRRNRGRRCATALVDGEFPTLVNEFSFIESNRIETTGISLFPLPE